MKKALSATNSTRAYNIVRGNPRTIMDNSSHLGGSNDIVRGLPDGKAGNPTSPTAAVWRGTIGTSSSHLAGSNDIVRGNPRTMTGDSSRGRSNDNIHFNRLTKRRAFSLIEVVLAIALFSFFSLSSISILLYSEDSLTSIGQNSRAANLAQEGIEASRAIKNEDFTLLADGDHGISSAVGKWQFSGTEDTVAGFKRIINLSTVDANTKKIISTVSWQKRTGHDATLTLETTLTNWSAYSGIPGFGNWTNPRLESYVTLTGGKDGVKIQVKDNNVYLVRDSAADSFVSIDIADTQNPRVSAQNNLKDNPKNLAVLNNLVLIATKSNSAELQTADITNPNSPAMKGDFNAEGAPDAVGIAGVGNLAYLTRLKGDGAEFYIIDTTNPDQLSEVGSLELDGLSAYEIIVIDKYAYISTGNTIQLKIVNISDPTKPNITGYFRLPQNQNAMTITGFDKTIIIGTDKGLIYIFDVTDPLNPQLKSTLTPKDNNNNIVYDIALGLDNHYLFIASNIPAREFQVYDISNPAAPLYISSFDTPGALYGVAYDNAKDRAFVTGVANAQSVIIIAPQ